MNRDQKKKLAEARLANPKAKQIVDVKVDKELRKAILAEYQRLHSLLYENSINSQQDLKNLYSLLKEATSYLDITADIKSLELAVKNIHIPDNKSVKVTNLSHEFAKLYEAVKENKPLPNEKPDYDPIIKALGSISDKIEKQTLDVKQTPQDFIPMRRVVDLGNRLVFDDGLTGMGSGGGGGSTTTSTGLTDDQLRASPVEITGTLTIDTTGLATSAKQDSQTTELQDIETDVEAINTRLGEVQASPTSNTVLDRLKVINTSLGTINTTLGGTLAISNTGLTELAAAINASSQLDVNIAAGNITGFATSAKQDTIIGHIDGIETLIGTTNSTLGTIDTDTGNISTKIDTLAGAVSGTEFQVDVLTMPTVTVNSHAVTNAGTFAVQVDGSALTSLQLIDDVVYAEDVASQDGDKGVQVLAIRDDTLNVRSGTEGDYEPFHTNASGALWVAGNGTFTVDGSGVTQPVSNAGLTALNGAISGSEVQVDVVTMPTTTVQATNLDIRDIDKGSDDILVYANTVKDGSGTSYVPLVDTDGHLQVDVLSSASHAVTNAGTFATQATLQAGDNAVGRVKLTDGTDVADILDLTNANPLTVAILDGDGTQITSFGGGTQYTEGDTDASITGTAMLWEDTSDTLRTVSSAKPLPISVATIPSHAVTNAGTFAVQVDGAALTALQLIDNIVRTEDEASGDGHSGVPALAVRQAAPANTSGTDGDYEFLRTSAGRQWVWAQPNVVTISTTITRPANTTAYAANDAFSDSTSAPTTGGYTFTGAALVSGGAGIITDCIVSASAGTNYNGEIWVFDQAVTNINDNAAFAISDAEAQTLVGIIPFQTNDTTSNNSVSYVTGLNIGYTCVGTANLRFLVKIMSAVTPGNAEVLAIRIKVQN